MKETRLIMGMPITVEIEDEKVKKKDFENVFKYFQEIDERFSPFKATSEVSRINQGKLKEAAYSQAMKEILKLSEQTKKLSDGYFDVTTKNGHYNPSGLVKGWAIYNAAKILQKNNFRKFYVDAGSDIEARGRYWDIGIRNPFNKAEIVKIVYLKDQGIATSGTYLRGQHIYNPKDRYKPATEIISLTVIGPNVYEADRFATAAFAMGKEGIKFIESLEGFEGYMIDNNKVATFTSNFEKYTLQPNLTHA